MDARVRETREVVLETGLRLLLEEGTSAVTHGRIAAETGLARTTVYRHWPTRSNLLFDSFMRGRNPVDVADTGDIRADLVAYLKGIRDNLWGSPIANVLVVVYDQMENDPDLAGVHDEIRDFVRADLTSMLERSRAAGHLSTDLATEDVLALLLGPIFYERLLGHSKASDELISHVVRAVVHTDTT